MLKARVAGAIGNSNSAEVIPTLWSCREREKQSCRLHVVENQLFFLVISMVYDWPKESEPHEGIEYRVRYGIECR